jgi:Ornithine carbamoyltransferase
MKDLISISKLTKEEIFNLLSLAAELKKKYHKGEEYKPLRDKTVITSFPANSLRTRISFEAGIFQLGANSVNMQIDLEGAEPIEDKIGYLNNWIDYLVIRYPKENLIEEAAKKAEFSVINAMSEESHPCEILSDFMALSEMRKDIKNLKIVTIGAAGNISNTWFELASKLDLNLIQICPAGYEINKELFEKSKKGSRGEIKITNNIKEGIKNADIVLTDGWPKVNDDRFLPYQITLDILKMADKNCIVNPCPPFTRGNEIADEIIKSRHFIGYRAKENLLHMQKAILASLSKN